MMQYNGKLGGIKPLVPVIERTDGKYLIEIKEHGSITNLKLNENNFLGKLYEDGFDKDDKCSIEGPFQESCEELK